MTKNRETHGRTVRVCRSACTTVEHLPYWDVETCFVNEKCSCFLITICFTIGFETPSTFSSPVSVIQSEVFKVIP